MYLFNASKVSFLYLRKYMVRNADASSFRSKKNFAPPTDSFCIGPQRSECMTSPGMRLSFFSIFLKGNLNCFPSGEFSQKNPYLSTTDTPVTTWFFNMSLIRLQLIWPIRSCHHFNGVADKKFTSRFTIGIINILYKLFCCLIPCANRTLSFERIFAQF